MTLAWEHPNSSVDKVRKVDVARLEISTGTTAARMSVDRYISDNALRVSGSTLCNNVSDIWGEPVLWTVGREYRCICKGSRCGSPSASPSDALLIMIPLLASSAKSTEGLFHSLTAHGLPNTPDAHHFVTEVYAQVPRKTKAKKAADTRSQPVTNKDLISKKFGLLLEDDGQEVSSARQKGKAKDGEERSKDKRKKEKEKSKDKHTRKRDGAGDEWESDEDVREFKRRRAEESHHVSREHPLAHYITILTSIT